MYIFIDTNIFLSFYHFTSEDLEELEKLVVLIDNKEVTILLPEQVVEEAKRNRATKIAEAFSSFKKLKFSHSAPAYCKDYPQYETMKKYLREAEISHATMVEKIEDDIKNETLKADILIDNLFNKAEVINRTSGLLETVRDRVSVGNPPGKKDSLGDAINWQSLLEKSPKRLPLHFITDDSDFYSPLDPSKLNEFLIQEWKNKKGSAVHPYRKISEFFSKNFPDINLKTESEKDALIEELSSSCNFSQTHSIIAKLSTYAGFTQKQAEDLLNALLNNNQVRWIISDSDVFDFYKKLDRDCVLVFEERYPEFSELMSKSILEEEIPF